jgi:hypothetical protein
MTKSSTTHDFGRITDVRQASTPLDSVQTIQWNSLNVRNNVNIELSRDGGFTYRTIFDRVPNTGAIQWAVTESPGSQRKIQVVSLADPRIRDSSDAVFKIIP